MNNDDRMRQFRQKVQNLSDPERERRARDFEQKLPERPVTLNRVYLAVRQVAVGSRVWIVARKTNEAAFPYVGQTNYTAKEISCKAKTADRDNALSSSRHPLASKTAGLVASPRLCPSSFTRDRLPSAMEEWQKFEPKLGRDGYELNETPGVAHYGCVKRHGQFIHGDLDLFDVINPEMVRDEAVFAEQKDGQTNKFTLLSRLVGDRINELLPAPMVLHGGQAQYGSFLDEGLLVFSPDGLRQPFELMSRIQARLWYKTRWPGRTPAGAGQDWLLREME